MRAKIHFPIWTIPLALLALCFVTYGITLTKHGFHWDDWSIAWYTHFLGPSIFPEAYARDRPPLGYLYVLTTSLVGVSPLGWQIFAIVTRWFSSLALWWTLRAIWPAKVWQITAATFLFTVYPGFSQHYIAITYGNAYLLYAIFLLSIGTMLWALCTPRRFWPFYLLSILLGAYSIFTMDYFFGLELLRPLLIWLALRERIPDQRQRIRKTGLYWSPYGLLLLTFLAWRIMTPTARGEINFFNDLLANPLTTIWGLIQRILGDFYTTSIGAWAKVADFSDLAGLGSSVMIKMTFIVIGASVLFSLYLVLLRSPGPTDRNSTTKLIDRWGSGALLFGLIALFVSGIPFWMTGLPIELSFTKDRFTLPMMFGVSLVMAGLIDLITRTRWQAALLIGVAVGFAAGLHYQTSLGFYQEWLLQKDFFWQLTWRAPGIQPGALVLTADTPFYYNWDHSLSSPLNWTYAPDLEGRELPYRLYNVESHLTRGLPDITADMRIYQRNRLTPFDGDTSQAIVVYYRPPACLKVIDPQFDRRMPDKPRYFRDLLPLSKPELILPFADPPAQPAAEFFAPEPAQDWCYFFQKAELARQQGDWTLAARMADLALQTDKKILRKNVVELIPFIQAYAHTGQWDKALQLSIEAHQTWENMRLMLCDIWTALAQSAVHDQQGQDTWQEIQNRLQCE